jgi:hypothetical protein
MMTIPLFIAILITWLAVVHTVIAIKDGGKLYEESQSDDNS